MSSTVLNNSSLHLMLHKSPPLSYSFLCVFGCLCYPYLRPYNRYKMSYESSPCVFLGYPESFNGYRCMDLHTNMIYVCMHVWFDEQVFPFAIKNILQAPQTSQSSPWVESVICPVKTVIVAP